MVSLLKRRRSLIGGLDPDAADFIARVEAADGQVLEAGVRDAYAIFIVGCKSDPSPTPGVSNLDAIKASCILAGARTLAGALVPLKGAAPTNFNFVQADYNRKTGLKGNGSTKYLNSNRNNNADPQNSRHLAVYRTDAGIILSNFQEYLSSASGIVVSNSVCILTRSGVTPANLAVAALGGQQTLANQGTVLGFFGCSRGGGSGFTSRIGSNNTFFSSASSPPESRNFTVFCRADASLGFTNARLSFYSIGEAVNLDLLDARVTALMAALNAAIP